MRGWIALGIGAASVGCKQRAEDEEPARPAELRIALADAVGGRIEDAWLDLGEVAVDRCTRPPASTVVGGPWSVAPPAALFATGGAWCGLDVVPDGVLEVWARADSGATLAGTIPLGPWSLTLDPPLRVDGDAFVVLLGHPGWLDLTDLAADVVVDPSSPGFAAAAAALARAELYPDDDGDGTVDDRADPLPSGG